MANMITTNSLEHQFWPVKSTLSISIGSTIPSMIHHKVTLSKRSKMIVSYSKYRDKTYAVSQSRRVLSPELLLKKFDYIMDCLKYVLGLTTAQREVTARLLRYWAYYGYVYPKEQTITEQPGCSKATFWRTIALLKTGGLLIVVNRYVCRPHAQISNLYRLDKLVVLLARYLAEHGVRFLEKWLTPALAMPGRLFWRQIWQSPEVRAGPGGLVF